MKKYFKKIAILTFLSLFLIVSIQSSFAINNTTEGGILKALDDAAPNDIIYLEPGTYTGTNNTDINIARNVTIIGNGSTENVIIDAEGQRRIFAISSDNINVTFINITFTNGNGGSGTGSTGVILSSMANITMSFINCTFTNNTGNTGAIRFVNGYCTVQNSTFKDNAGTWSGTIWNAGNLVVANSRFINSTSTSLGGAIRNEGNLTVDTSTFIYNTAISGAAIHNFGPSTNLNVSTSVFYKNNGNNAINISSVANYNLENNFYCWVFNTSTPDLAFKIAETINNPTMFGSFFYMVVNHVPASAAGQNLLLNYTLVANGTSLANFNANSLAFKNGSTALTFDFATPQTDWPFIISDVNEILGFYADDEMFYQITPVMKWINSTII